MKYKNFLNDILGQKSKLKALRFLSNLKNEVSIRELAREIKITPPNLSIILNDLEKQNLLISRHIGTSIVYTLNSGHYLVEEIIKPLFRKEREARMELGREIKNNFDFQYESVIIFGSIARIQEHPGSDIDLAVIINSQSDISDIENKIININPVILKKFGNSLSPIIMKKSDFIGKLKSHDKLVVSIAKDGLLVAGKSVSELIA
jgi:DNA-binding transcriptional ArsR family regulator